MDLRNKDRSKLMLAGTMALKNASKTPQDVIKERAGFFTTFKLPTIDDQKMTAAQDALNKKIKGEFIPVPNEFIPPSDHKFRENDLQVGQKDFTVSYSFTFSAPIQTSSCLQS